MTTLPRILLVEDDPADMRLTLEVLRELNLADQVVIVTDGVEAADFLGARNAFQDRPPGNPAIVLLDLKLPRVDGLEVLAMLKGDPLQRCIPVVCLTSSREDRDLRRAYELGANGYVVKTIDFEEYTASIRALGTFWAITNEPPPGSLPKPRGVQQKPQSSN